MTPYEAAGLLFGCGYCHARPGDRCRVVKGRTAGKLSPWQHQDRHAQVWEVLRITGMRDEVEAWRKRARAAAVAAMDAQTEIEQKTDPADPISRVWVRHTLTKIEAAAGWGRT